MAVKIGDWVKFHYTGKFENGEIFASTRDKRPAECKVGEGKFPGEIEDALAGMEMSEKKKVVIPPDRYGRRDETLVKKFPKSTLGSFEGKVGKIIKLENEKGRIFNAKVVAIEPEIVTLDLNHPLAGRTLRFDIEVTGIQ